jgi:hypothetical protein
VITPGQEPNTTIRDTDMTEVTTPESAEERQARLKTFFDKISTVLTEKYGASVEDLEEAKGQILASLDIMASARMPFPFTEKETMAILKAPIEHSWLHPITNLSHKLLLHHNVVNEPFMIGGVDKEEGDEKSKGIVCQCFYATVRVKADEIRVYSNWDAGGMCDETIEHLVAIHPTPAYMTALMPQLEQIAVTQLSQPVTVYDQPLKIRLKLPQPECSGPGL